MEHIDTGEGFEMGLRQESFSISSSTPLRPSVSSLLRICTHLYLYIALTGQGEVSLSLARPCGTHCRRSCVPIIDADSVLCSREDSFVLPLPYYSRDSLNRQGLLQLLSYLLFTFIHKLMAMLCWWADRESGKPVAVRDVPDEQVVRRTAQ